MDIHLIDEALERTAGELKRRKQTFAEWNKSVTKEMLDRAEITQVTMEPLKFKRPQKVDLFLETEGKHFTEKSMNINIIAYGKSLYYHLKYINFILLDYDGLTPCNIMLHCDAISYEIYEENLTGIKTEPSTLDMQHGWLHNHLGHFNHNFAHYLNENHAAKCKEPLESTKFLPFQDCAYELGILNQYVNLRVYILSSDHPLMPGIGGKRSVINYLHYLIPETYGIPDYVSMTIDDNISGIYQLSPKCNKRESRVKKEDNPKKTRDLKCNYMSICTMYLLLWIEFLQDKALLMGGVHKGGGEGDKDIYTKDTSYHLYKLSLQRTWHLYKMDKIYNPYFTRFFEDTSFNVEIPNALRLPYILRFAHVNLTDNEDLFDKEVVKSYSALKPATLMPYYLPILYHIQEYGELNASSDFVFDYTSHATGSTDNDFMTPIDSENKYAHFTIPVYLYFFFKNIYPMYVPDRQTENAVFLNLAAAVLFELIQERTALTGTGKSEILLKYLDRFSTIDPRNDPLNLQKVHAIIATLSTRVVKSRNTTFKEIRVEPVNENFITLLKRLMYFFGFINGKLQMKIDPVYYQQEYNELFFHSDALKLRQTLAKQIKKWEANMSREKNWVGKWTKKLEWSRYYKLDNRSLETYTLDPSWEKKYELSKGVGQAQEEVESSIQKPLTPSRWLQESFGKLTFEQQITTKPSTELEAPQWNVEKLLAREKQNGRVMFYVKWANDPTPTWEPRVNLVKDIPAMVRAYEKSV